MPSIEGIDKLMAVGRQSFDYVWSMPVPARLEGFDPVDASPPSNLVTQFGVSELRNFNRLISSSFQAGAAG